MKIDFTRLLLVLLGFYVAQIFLSIFLTSLGLTGLPLIITFNLLLSFIATLIYYPSVQRKDAFKDPDFYKNVAIFMFC